MNKSELIDLLVRVYEYMSDRADSDDSGMSGNLESDIASELSDMLYLLGQKEFGSSGRASVDPNFRLGGISLQESKSFNLRKFLTENKLTPDSKLNKRKPKLA